MYLGISKPTVLRGRPSNYGVITYYFVGFGDTGSVQVLRVRVSAAHPSAQLEDFGRDQTDS